MIKKILFSIPLMFMFVCADVFAQEIIAEDNAANYTSNQFQDLENLGTGFGDWYRVINGDDAAVVLQSAADNGSNSAVINTEGNAFALRSSAGEANDQRVDLGRQFAQPLADGESLNFELAWNWAQPGLTGFVLYNGSWDNEDQSMVLDFDAAGYFVNFELAEEHASQEDWDSWREGGVALDVTITRNGNNLEYSVVALTAESHVNFSGILEGVNADRIKFFNEGRPNWGDTGQGSMFVNSLMIMESTSTSVDGNDELANRFTLEQNYPNPFNPSTTITYTLENSSQIQLAVYDMLGRELQVLEQGLRSAGEHTVQFDASALTSGIYLYRLSADGYTTSKRMTLIK